LNDEPLRRLADLWAAVAGRIDKAIDIEGLRAVLAETFFASCSGSIRQAARCTCCLPCTSTCSPTPLGRRGPAAKALPAASTFRMRLPRGTPSRFPPAVIVAPKAWRACDTGVPIVW